MVVRHAAAARHDDDASSDGERGEEAQPGDHYYPAHIMTGRERE